MRGYTDQTIDANGNLVFTLTEDGRDEISFQAAQGDKSDEDIFVAMIEDHLENGLQFVRPEEIGALTSSLLLTDGHRDDDGDYEGDGSIWYFDRYMIVGYAETLAYDGKIVFQKAGE